MRGCLFGRIDLLEPPFDKTTRRSAQSHTVLIAHDTSELLFALHDELARENLSHLRANQQGFCGYASVK
ncbi:hypothetical protein DL240_11275 [Lujinxingia litoralis]|uniref:Uncharacterized protein n=1 Tax=Lujinxingia litoralis TaxID=2211119 RepID=A0A328C524_9DELT|nr:hypothetical protein DL240_11275 [Lujinxingia litoralis]